MNAPEIATTPMQVLRMLTDQVDPEIRQRAYEYMGRTRFETCTRAQVSATVLGTKLYSVTLSRVKDMVNYTCTCPYFSGSLDTCKHVWAVIGLAATRGFLGGFPTGMEPILIPLENEDLHGDLRPKHGDVAGLPALQPAPQPSPPWERALQARLALARDARPASPTAVRALSVAFRIDLSEFSRRGGLVLNVLFQEAHANGKTRSVRTNKIRRSEAMRRLPQEVAAAFSTLCGAGDTERASWHSFDDLVPPRVRVTGEVAPLILPGLCRSKSLLLPNNGSGAPIALEWDGGAPWDLVITFVPRDDGKRASLITELWRDSRKIPWDDVIAASGDGILITRSFIGRVNLHGGIPIVEMLHEGGGMTVPSADLPRFVGRLLEFPNLPRIEPPPGIAIETRTVRPTPALRVKQAKGPRPCGYEADAAFDYEGRSIDFFDRGSGWWDETSAAAIRRDREFEEEARSRLAALGFKLGGFEPTLSIAATKLPIALRELIASGWRVTAEGKTFRPAGTWRLAVNSGVDWFDLEGGIDFDGEIVPLPRLLAAARKGEKSIVLTDGSIGMVPEEWMRKYGGLAGLGDADGDRVRFSQGQVGLLDALLAAQPEIQVDAACALARERLRTFERITPAAEPRGFSGELRPYQREGLAWLRFLEEFGFGGCLADDMGLGKTVQLLAYLLGRKRKGPALVVCPRSLIFNWKAEAERFAPKLRVLDHSGADRKPPGRNFDEHDLVLTTYGILRRDAPKLSNVAFDVVVLDEAQAIKNRDTESAKAARLLKARQRIALSGTPIENRLAELGSLFEFLNPGLLGHATAFDELTSTGDPDALAALARALRPFILRRTKDQVIKDLPAKTEQTISCDLEGPQRKLYDELRDHYRGALLGKLDEAGLGRAKIQVLEALLRLRQAACHPGLIDKTKAGESSPKLDVLLARLEEVTAEGHKALVFSQFTSLLAIVKKQLDARGATYEYLDGKTRDREARVKRFREDPACPIFLISLKAGGLGLNLVEADYVFLLDPWWNPAVEAQAIDRTHRIGQTRSVFAYRLIARDTVEEKVLELQGQKRALADAIIRADESLIRSLTRDDLELLLS